MPELPEDTIRAPKIEDLRAFLVRDGRTQHLREALEEVEWNGSMWVGFHTCPECSNEKQDGHADDCAIAAALAVRGPSQDREEAQADRGSAESAAENLTASDADSAPPGAVCDPAPPPASKPETPGNVRYEVGALIGPCTFAEAEAFLVAVTSGKKAWKLGACWSVGPAPAESGEPPQ